MKNLLRLFSFAIITGIIVTFSLCINPQKGKVLFQDPLNGEFVAGWNDPEANHDCRLKPDHFEIELPLQAGENEILLRSQVTENWGWGFWMRIE